MTEKMYNFKFQNIKAIRYLGLVFLGIPLIFLLGPNHLGVGLFMFVLFGPIVFGMVMLFIKIKAEDIIYIRDMHLDSSYFGEICYTDIRSISSPILYGKPCIRLKLSNGKRVTWALSSGRNSFIGREDIYAFSEFTEALERKIKEVDDKSLSAIIAIPQSEDLKVPSLTEQLEKVKKKNNTSTWAIPIGLVLGVLALVRTCGDDWFKQRNPIGPEATKKSAEIFLRRSNDAKLVLEKLVNKSGPYFLYSNDTSASLTLVPDLDMGNPTDISAFKYIAANKSLEAFIDHPDSVKLDLYIVSTGNHTKKLSKSVLNTNDSTKTYLYFRAYDPTIQDSSASPKTTDLKSTVVTSAFDVTTGIPLYNTQSLAKAISETFPGMNMMLANVRLRPSSFKLYLAARNGAGIDEAIFRKAVRELNKQMNAVNVDTTTFKLKIFYKNISRDGSQ